MSVALVSTAWYMARLEMQTFLTWRLNLALQSLGMLARVYFLNAAWTAVYAGRAEVDGVPLDTLVAYLTLANIHVWVIYPQTLDVLPGRIRSGAVALDLARPIGLLPQLAARSVGGIAGLTAFVVALLPVAFLLGSLRPPASPEAGALYVASVLLAYGVTLAIGIVLALIAFWTLEINGIGLLYYFVNLFFAGALVPLWAMPGWVRAVAELLPFQTQAYLPLSIYFGRLAGPDALRALGVQVVWLILMWALAAFVWRRAIHHVVVQGG